MFRIAVAAMAAFVAVAAVQPAFAKLASNKLASNKLSANTAATNAPSGTVDRVTSIVLPNGQVVRR